MNFQARNIAANPLNTREIPPKTRNETTTVANVRADKPRINITTITPTYDTMLRMAAFFNLGIRATVNNRHNRSSHAKGNPP